VWTNVKWGDAAEAGYARIRFAAISKERAATLQVSTLRRITRACLLESAARYVITQTSHSIILAVCAELFACPRTLVKLLFLKSILTLLLAMDPG